MNAELHDDARTDDEDNRVYPAERAFSTPRDRPEWERISPGLSGGWREVHEALDADPEVFTSS